MFPERRTSNVTIGFCPSRPSRFSRSSRITRGAAARDYFCGLYLLAIALTVGIEEG